MARTKKEIIQEKIDANIEDIYKMEIVRDVNKELDTPEAKEQVKAAVHRIMEGQGNITWLEEYIKKCE